MSQPEAHQIITHDGIEYWLNDGDKRRVMSTPGDMGLPPLKFITEEQYNGDGVSLIDSFARQRRVGIRVDISGCSRDEYLTIRAELINIARLNRGGELTYIYYRADGSKRAIRGLPTTPTFQETSTEEYQEMAVQFTFEIDCFDPAWFDPDAITVIAAGCTLVAAYNEQNLSGALPVMLGMARRMVSYWSYDGTLTEDNFGSNDLTNNNGVTQVPGRVGQAANFVSASSQTLSHADNASLSPERDFSFLFWYRPTTLGTDQTPILKWDGAADNAYFFYKNASDGLTFVVSDDGTATTAVVASTYGAMTSNWQLVHGYHDDGVNIGIGINGIYDTAAHTTGVFDSSQPFQLGASVDGDLDETALWTRLLSAAEFQHYYNGGLGRDFDEIVPAVRIAQPFIVTETTQIGVVQAWLQRVGDVLNQSVFARIYDDSGGSPNASLYETTQFTDELPGVVALNAFFTHEANCRLRFDLTALQSVGTTEFRFRRVDTNNYWLLSWGAPGTLNLLEKVAGGYTLRVTMPGVLSSGAAIVVTCIGEIITIYVNGVQTGQYTSAANFKTATQGQWNYVGGFNGEVRDIITFTYPGNAQSLASGAPSAFAMTFDTPPTLTPGTYWFAVESSLTESVENYISWASDTNGDYAAGTAKAYRNGAWVDTGLSMIFEVFEYCPDDRQLVFPITFPIQFDGDDVFDSESITYQGTWYSYPTITVTGPLNNFRIRHAELEKDIFYLGSLAMGASLVLDLANRTLVDEDGVNRWNLLGPLTDIQDFRLQPAPVVPGGINTLQFFADGFRDGYTTFSVEYETRYIGI